MLAAAVAEQLTQLPKPPEELVAAAQVETQP
jgi:hypothetical protein